MPDQFLCSNEVHKSIAAQVREEEREKIRAIVAHAIKDEQEKILSTLPALLICQSLPNESGFCGDNDCLCKFIHWAEGRELCAWMQKIRRGE